MPYDLFISYSRKDNRNHRITELKDRIAADYLAFSGEPLRCFFDLDDIHGMDDWRHRILEGRNREVRQSYPDGIIWISFGKKTDLRRPRALPLT